MTTAEFDKLPSHIKPYVGNDGYWSLAALQMQTA